MEQTERQVERIRGQRFASPAEELAFLRQQVQEKERLLHEQGYNPERAQVASETVREYAQTAHREVLTQEHALSEDEIGAIVLDIAPDEHDAAIADLLGVMQEKGIRNAIEVSERLDNAHLEDDWHKVLVQYVVHGHPVDLKEREPMWNLLHMTLFEVSLPEPTKEESQKPFKEIVSSMDQLYAALFSAAGGGGGDGRHIAIEFAVPHDRQDLSMYVALPHDRGEQFEKNILSIFPRARVREEKSDYNVFVEHGGHKIATAYFAHDGILPLKMYEEFEYDPLSFLVNAFSKIGKEGEGAAVQFVISPVGERYVKRINKVIEKMKKGKKLKEALRETPETLGGEIFKAFKDIAKDVSGEKKREQEKQNDPANSARTPQVDEAYIEALQKKSTSPIASVNIRIVVSAETAQRAQELLADITSSFSLFEHTHGNTLKFHTVSDRELARETKRFTYREFCDDEVLPLSIKELTTMAHFPAGTAALPHMKVSKAVDTPAPFGLPQEGTLLGVNRYRDVETKVYMTPTDRLRHFYVIGQTGTGKTTILKNMIVQDIRQGAGVCMIDPHGSDIQEILANIPEERYDDVIYFDPAHMEDVMGLNMLEYDPAHPEQKTFVVNELLAIFKKLYSGSPESMGPAFEQYFRNATMLVMEDPATGNTMLDISRVLTDPRFRELKLSRSSNPVVNQFWREVATKTSGESSLANIVPYITNKFDVFTANEIMRPIIAQERSAIRMREIMDTKKILLVNLAKGLLGDINANLIGLILVGKILMAALSRVDSVGQDLPPFYLYIDEFQNITTDSISSILSEARKYKLSLTIAHQFLAQIDEKILASVFGNVGSIAAYRVGAEDAEKLEQQFTPTIAATDLMNIENYHAYLRLLANGVPQKPFSLGIMPPSKGQPDRIDYLKQRSYTRHGRPRRVVEEEIRSRYNIG